MASAAFSARASDRTEIRSWRAALKPALLSDRAAVSPAAPAPAIKQSEPRLWSAVPPPTRLRFDQARPNRVAHHAGRFMDVQLFENAATMRVGRFVADSQCQRGFL